MSKRTVVIMLEVQRRLEIMGEQIKMARLRRNLVTELVAEDDEFGRKLQDLNIQIRGRAKRGK